MSVPVDHAQVPVAPAAPAPAPANAGPINDHDIEDWKNRFNTVLGNAGETINSKSAEGAQGWSNQFFGCCSPIDLCLITYCLPCVTFGKIHHRTRKNGNMEGYEPINTSCLLFLASACFGLHWIPESMQRADIRRKYNLEGSCLTDIAIACCCALCDLTQQEKETTIREKEHSASQYASTDNMMVYGKQG